MSYRISDAQYAMLESFYCAYRAMEQVFSDDEACHKLKRINELLNLLLSEVFSSRRMIEEGTHMKTRVIWGPEFVTEALFGIGLSYGLTSDMEDVRVLSRTPKYERLMKVARGLAHKQGGHNKFLETIMFSLDVDAPRYWWQEFDTYRVGVTKQSESTMHTITKRTLTSNDFEGGMADIILRNLNSARAEARTLRDDARMLNMKRYLPESFLQRRIVCLNAKALQNMYNQRKNHRLPEWRKFFDGISGYLISLSDGDIDSAFVRYCIFGDGENAGRE